MFPFTVAEPTAVILIGPELAPDELVVDTLPLTVMEVGERSAIEPEAKPVPADCDVKLAVVIEPDPDIPEDMEIAPELPVVRAEAMTFCICIEVDALMVTAPAV